MIEDKILEYYHSRSAMYDYIRDHQVPTSQWVTKNNVRIFDGDGYHISKCTDREGEYFNDSEVFHFIYDDEFERLFSECKDKYDELNTLIHRSLMKSSKCEVMVHYPDITIEIENVGREDYDESNSVKFIFDVTFNPMNVINKVTEFIDTLDLTKSIYFD